MSNVPRRIRRIQVNSGGEERRISPVVLQSENNITAVVDENTNGTIKSLWGTQMNPILKSCIVHLPLNKTPLRRRNKLHSIL